MRMMETVTYVSAITTFAVAFAAYQPFVAFGGLSLGFIGAALTVARLSSRLRALGEDPDRA